MNTDKLKEFDQFFVREYRYLMGFTKSINPAHDYESTLHDVYLRLRDRIEINGFQGNDYLNYTRCALMNFYKSHYRNQKNKIIVDIEDPDFYNNIEQTLLQNQIQVDQEAEQQHINSYLNTMIYEYVEQNFKPKEIFVFKTYFLLKHKRLNYKTLAETTGFSITSVSNIIKRMKKSIKSDLSLYITSGYTENLNK